MPTSSDSRPDRAAGYLVIDRVTAGYGGAPVVSGISLSVARGEIVAVIGPNGSGKSTLLKAVSGVIRAMSGTVHVGNEDVTNLRGDQLAAKGVGYVPQSNDVFNPLTVEENLEMGGYLLDRRTLQRRRDEVLSLLPALRPLVRRLAGRLSGGERKMLAIGRVLMLQPAVLLLDEPTAGLSPQMAHVLLKEHVRHLSEAGTVVLLVEQRATAALEIAQWAYVFVAGTVQLEGAARELLARADIGEVFLGGRR